MLHHENKVVFSTNRFKTRQWVKTVCRIYAGLQKDQRTKLTPLPKGMKCEIRAIELVKIDNYPAVLYYLVRIPVTQNVGQKQLQYWARLGESCITSDE